MEVKSANDCDENEMLTILSMQHGLQTAENVSDRIHN